MGIFKAIGVSVILGIGLLAAGCGAGSVPSDVMVEATGPWALENESSALNYTTIKSGDIAEPNTFKSLTGSVSEDGAAEVMIVLDSIWTNIDTRDVRMREFVFKTNEHPFAVIKSQIDMNALSGLQPGERTAQTIDLNVSLAGKSHEYIADVFVTRLGANRVSVESRTPIYVKPDDFGVQADVDYLQELAKLPSITPLAPVSFSLVFKRGS